MTTTQEQAPVAWAKSVLNAAGEFPKHSHGDLEPYLSIANSIIAMDAELTALRQPQAARLTEELQRIRQRVSYQLNDKLCNMKPDYDDSITGFNEASDIVFKILVEELDRLTAAPATTPQIDTHDEDDYGEGGGDVRGNLYEAEARRKTHNPYPHLTALAAAQQVTREELIYAMCSAQWSKKHPNGPDWDWALTNDPDSAHFIRKAEISADAILSLPALRGLVKEG